MKKPELIKPASAALIVVLLLCLCSPASAAAETPEASAPSEAKETILSIGGYWRIFVMHGPGQVPLDLLKKAKPDSDEPANVRATPLSAPPASDWMKPDFADAGWGRAKGTFLGGRRGHADIWALYNRELICLRGKFAVDRPEAVKRLTLAAKFRGGIVVYLNGAEVTRSHLPEGELEPRTPGTPYAKDAYVDSKGKIIPCGYHVNNRIKKGEKDLAERIGKRSARGINPIELPLKSLRKGVNVLAIEVHRSAFQPEALKWKGNNSRSPWPHIGLSALRLAADAESGSISPNVARPHGLQVWNQDPHSEFGEREYADPNEEPGPIRLIGGRNGTYSGMVVVGSTKPLTAVKAVASDLGGAGSIPTANISVRFCGLTRIGRGYRQPAVFAILESSPPQELKINEVKISGRGIAARKRIGLPDKPVAACVLPVWVTVKVPETAAVGKYKGALTLSASGMDETKVPIELEVVDWSVPNSTEFRTFMGLYQSPDTVALYYNVSIWSDKHWALLEESFRRLGELGNNFISIPLVNRTEFGNEECMVPWIKQADGTYKQDFSAFDRYIDLAKKYCNIKRVSLQTYYGGGWGAADPSNRPVFVTVVDPTTKKREAWKMPLYGTEESRKLWTPYIAEVHARLKKKGLAEAMMFGIGHCGGMNKGVVSFFKTIAPDTGWHIAKHNRPRAREFPKHRYVEWMYIPGTLPRKTKMHVFPNDGKGLVCLMMQRIRDGGQTAVSFRTVAERARMIGDTGVGRICLDFWPIKMGKKSRGIYDRYPNAMANQRKPHFSCLAMPGKNGAASSPKLEAFRESLQEAEARYFIQDALREKKVNGELADKCTKLLADRYTYCQLTHSGLSPHDPALACTDRWQKRSARIYRLAAEVAAALGKKEN